MRGKEADRIKVLHVAEASGGVDRYLKSLFKYMDRDKFENIFICSQNFDKEEYIPLVDHIEQIPMVHSIQWGEDKKTIGEIRKFIKQYQPDVVYGHSSKAGALLRMADLGINNKVLYNPHGWYFNMRTTKKRKEKFKWIERVQVPFTDKIICISEAEKQSALREHICKEDKLQVIYNGIDLDAIEKAPRISREEVGIPAGAFVVGMVGRITEQKAPDVFVEAARLIKEKIDNAFFVIVGDSIAGSDEEKKLVLEMIHRYGLEDSFLITGWVSNPTAYMRLFDVGVLLSRWEGFGLVLPEYMACGVPIVATKVDAIPYLIKDGETGLLVDVDDVESTEKAVMELNENSSLRSKLDNNENAKVERFSARITARDTERLILRLI